MHFYRPHPKHGGRYCFQFVSSHLGGGIPQSGLGGYPIPGLARRGYPIPGLDGGGVHHPRSAWAGGGGTWGIPLDQVRMGYPPPPGPGMGYPPDLGWGNPPPDLGWGSPRHSEHLLRGGRCASCVHAGGLSCCY